MNKFGTQDVCPKCSGFMHKVGEVGNGDGTVTETHQCASCKYKAETVVASETGETPTTPENGSM